MRLTQSHISHNHAAVLHNINRLRSVAICKDIMSADFDLSLNDGHMRVSEVAKREEVRAVI